MKYFILFTIILGLSTCDILIIILKDSLKSCTDAIKKMLCECLVMGSVCGLAMGIEVLGKYYQSAKLSEIIGICVACAIFVRIMITNIISIFENYAELNPNAAWTQKIIEKLKNLEI